MSSSHSNSTVIDGSSITTFQSCRRRWLLEQRWRVLRWRPKSLFDSCLRQAIFAISNGADPAEQVQSSRTRFLSQAANPGLDLSVGAESWTVANDYAGMLATVLTALSRATLLTVGRPAPQAVEGSGTSEVLWQPLSWMDESGTLHRWITADAFDQDVLAREAHGWRVFGDMCAMNAPLTLHVIDIGQQRGGRRHSPWARAWKHPVIAGRFKFQRNDGQGGHRALSGEQWKPLWYTDQGRPDPISWVDLMDAEGVTPGLLHTIAIRQPSETIRQSTLRQIGMLAEQMRDAEARMALSQMQEPAMLEPMSRGSCDGWVPCPWQDACYREKPAEGVGSLGLYQIRRPEVVASGSSRPQMVASG